MVAIPDMYNASDSFGIDTQISRFVVPLAAALKGDGSAAFIGASAIFIAQINDVPITAATAVTVMYVDYVYIKFIGMIVSDSQSSNTKRLSIVRLFES